MELGEICVAYIFFENVTHPNGVKYAKPMVFNEGLLQYKLWLSIYLFKIILIIISYYIRYFINLNS